MSRLTGLKLATEHAQKALAQLVLGGDSPQRTVGTTRRPAAGGGEGSCVTSPHIELDDRGNLAQNGGMRRNRGAVVGILGICLFSACSSSAGAAKAGAMAEASAGNAATEDAAVSGKQAAGATADTAAGSGGAAAQPPATEPHDAGVKDAGDSTASTQVHAGAGGVNATSAGAGGSSDAAGQAGEKSNPQSSAGQGGAGSGGASGSGETQSAAGAGAGGAGGSAEPVAGQDGSSGAGSTEPAAGQGGGGAAGEPATDLCTGPKPAASAFGASPVAIDGPSPGLGAPEARTNPGAAAPRYRLTDFQTLSCGYNATYGLDAFQGRPTLVALFASWCPYCQVQVGKLQQLSLELEDAGKKVYIVVINASVKNSPAGHDPIEEQYQLLDRVTFPLLQDTDEIDAWKLHGGFKDDLFIYRSDGKLQAYLPGYMGTVPIDLTTTEGYTAVKELLSGTP